MPPTAAGRPSAPMRAWTFDHQHAPLFGALRRARPSPRWTRLPHLSLGRAASAKAGGGAVLSSRDRARAGCRARRSTWTWAGWATKGGSLYSVHGLRAGLYGFFFTQDDVDVVEHGFGRAWRTCSARPWPAEATGCLRWHKLHKNGPRGSPGTVRGLDLMCTLGRKRLETKSPGWPPVPWDGGG